MRLRRLEKAKKTRAIMALQVGDWAAHCVLSFSEKTRKHRTEIGVQLWARLTRLEKAKTIKSLGRVPNRAPCSSVCSPGQVMIMLLPVLLVR